MPHVEILAITLAGVSGWLWAGPGVARRRLMLIDSSGRRAESRPVVVVGRLVRGMRPAGAHKRLRQTATIELCEALAAELRAGRNPAEALRRAADVAPEAFAEEFAPALLAARSGTDASQALWHAGARPGAAGLRRLGVCFRVGADSGGAFAPAVERLGAALRDEDAARQEVSAQLAGARATARLLAVLPFLGTFLGFGLGVDPFAFWFASPAGFGSLAAGVALDIAGLLWMRRLAHGAEARS